MQEKYTPFEHILSLFPKEAREKIERVQNGYFGFAEKLSEIRLRANRFVSLTVEGKNLPVHFSFTEEDLAYILRLCCENSVYAYTESLREGYVTFHGSRVGVAGRAVLEDGVLTGIDHVTSLVFRIPHSVHGAANTAVSVFRALGEASGILVYSPPGVGKTTLLHDMARQLSRGPKAKRVAIVDCRGELSGEDLGESAMVDILRDYPKAEGIEIATRTLSPEVVICDEIGGFDEAESILGVQNCGVPLIASAHAATFSTLLKRPPIRLLLECDVFGAFVGVTRQNGQYAYHIDYARDIPKADRGRKETEECYSKPLA